ncbi:hypothetical protein DL96DRAFT_1625154 [Flagelloscypha sp. PMI_526]|nr:hypothetical protein DL96DRAFT_1625154 [Flagelloscypha sp. PMI_526]
MRLAFSLSLACLAVCTIRGVQGPTFLNSGGFRRFRVKMLVTPGDGQLEGARFFSPFVLGKRIENIESERGRNKAVGVNCA